MKMRLALGVLFLNAFPWNPAMADFWSDDPNTLNINNFFFVNRGVNAVKIELSNVRLLIQKWEKSTEEANIAQACFLSGSLSAHASAASAEVAYLEKYDPRKGSDREAHSVRMTYFSHVRYFMSFTKFYTSKLAEICMGKMDLNEVRGILQSMQDRLSEDLKEVDSNRKRAIEASGLSDILIHER